MLLPAHLYCWLLLMPDACILSISASSTPINRKHSRGVSLRMRNFVVFIKQSVLPPPPVLEWIVLTTSFKCLFTVLPSLSLVYDTAFISITLQIICGIIPPLMVYAMWAQVPRCYTPYLPFYSGSYLCQGKDYRPELYLRYPSITKLSVGQDAAFALIHVAYPPPSLGANLNPVPFSSCRALCSANPCNILSLK